MVNDSKSSAFEVIDVDLHYNLIHYINDLFTLGITVKGESESQRLFEKYEKNKENKPDLNKPNIEKKFLDSIERYYHINSREIDSDYNYIFCVQHNIKSFIEKKHIIFCRFLFFKVNLKKSNLRSLFFRFLSPASFI